MTSTPLSSLLRATERNQDSYTSIILKLLAKGARVHSADFAHVASPSIIHILLGTGAKPNAQVFFSVIMFLRGSQSRPQMDILVPLLEAVSPSELNAMRDHDDDFPLLHTAINMVTLDVSKPELIQLLLDYGLDPEAQDASGNNAYQFAQQSGNSEAIKILSDYRKNLEQHREQFKATTKEEMAQHFSGQAAPVVGIITEYAYPEKLPHAPAAGAHAPGGVAAGAAAAPVSGSEMKDVD